MLTENFVSRCSVASEEPLKAVATKAKTHSSILAVTDTVHAHARELTRLDAEIMRNHRSPPSRIMNWLEGGRRHERLLEQTIGMDESWKRVFKEIEPLRTRVIRSGSKREKRLYDRMAKYARANAVAARFLRLRQAVYMEVRTTAWNNDVEADKLVQVTLSSKRAFAQREQAGTALAKIESTFRSKKA